MIEEFAFTTKVLQAEKDINSLRSLIAMHVRDKKDEFASLTWARLTWEQRVTLNKTAFVSTIYSFKSPDVFYHLPKMHIRCETLSQMQF